jgi:hypothetical protein
MVLRYVNERVARIADGFRVYDEPYDFLCECGVTGCRTPVVATIAEYDRVRAHPSTWLVAPDHVNDEREEVVYRTEHFAVVRLIGDASVPASFSPLLP